MSRLYRVYKERLKFYILILLVITSIVQLGILWSYQNQGLPFNFMHLFNSKQTAANNIQSLQDSFSPYKIVVSEGFDSPKWIMNKKNTNYEDLWKDAKFFISNVFKMKSTNTYPLTDWYDYIDKNVFIFDFKTNIKTGLLKDFLNLSDVITDSPTGIYKMIISPWEDKKNYNNIISIYINDGIKIYKYDLNINSDAYTRYISRYDRIISELLELSKNSEIVNYSFSRFFLGDKSGFSEDATVVHMEINSDFKSLLSYLPSGIGSNGSENTYEIASNILGLDKDNYDRIIDPDRSIELKTLTNIYKIHPDGFMEYNYLPAQANIDKGSLEAAFNNAFEFVNKMNILNYNKDISLSFFVSGYVEEKNSYKFMFDYMVSDETNDIPIYINYKYNDNDGKKMKLNNAVVVTANSKNVLNAKAMIKAFKYTGESKLYGIGLPDSTYLSDVTLPKTEGVEKDISISYEMDSEDKNPELKMAWIIKNGDKYFSSPMIKK